MTPNEKLRLQLLEEIVAKLVKSDRYTILKMLEIADGINLQFSTTTGTKIGTATTQKLGFFNKTPIVQPSAIGAPNNQGGTYVQADVQSIVTAVNNIRTALTNLGLTG